jgi:hypothetical protein
MQYSQENPIILESTCEVCEDIKGLVTNFEKTIC